MGRKTGGITALAGTLAAIAGAAPAQAGIYTVNACSAAGRQWDNRSWELVDPVNSITADQDCAGDNNIGLNQAPGGRTADGAQASLQFLTPAGTTIDRWYGFRRSSITGLVPAYTSTLGAAALWRTVTRALPHVGRTSFV